jgi:TRAP-type transport system periplasmic protein
MRRWFVTLTLCLAAGTIARSARAATTLRFATLAPRGSAWGELFRVWQRAIREKTHGKLQVTVYYGGVEGGDSAMVGKMKSGQLDGAALTSVGLARIDRNVLVLQLPGVVDSWSLLDRVRGQLGPHFEQSFRARGFSVLGWGDVGLVRQMSRGFAVHRPSDLRGQHPLVWRNEPIGPVVFSTIGGIVPVPLAPMDVLPALRAGRVNVLSAPTLAAEQLQWTAYLDHVSSTPSVCAIGASVMSNHALDGLPADERATFLMLNQRMAALTKHRVRDLDRASYQRLAGRMTVVQMNDADRAAWRRVLVEATRRLAQGEFDRALVHRVLQITGKH